MKLTYDRLREITDRAENAIDEETYLKNELEEVIDEMTAAWQEVDRLKKKLQASRDSVYGISTEGDEARCERNELREENELLKSQLDDAVNTLVHYADQSNWTAAYSYSVFGRGMVQAITSPKPWSKASEAIQRIKGECLRDE